MFQQKTFIIGFLQVFFLQITLAVKLGAPAEQGLIASGKFFQLLQLPGGKWFGFDVLPGETFGQFNFGKNAFAGGASGKVIDVVQRIKI